MFDMMKMMGKLQELRQRMQQAQQELEAMRTVGSSGGGVVRATVNGKKQLLSLEIDPILKDNQIIQNLVLQAVNEANQAADAMAKEHIKKSTEGLLPNIPGMDFGNLMGGS